MSRRRSRRDLLAAIFSVLVPGLGPAALQRRRDFWVLPGLFGALALVALAWVRAQSRLDLLHLAFEPDTLLALAVILIVLGALHAWSVLTVTRTAHTTTPAVRVCAGLLALCVLTAWSWAASLALSQRMTVLEVFSVPPSSAPQASGGPSYQTSPTNTAQLHRGEFTVLLLGGDAGKGRWSRRTDTIIAVRADLDSGTLAFVSVPRNLMHLPFPEGTKLHQAYPHGFDDLANALYVRVSARPELAETTAAEPGLEALKTGVSELLGWQIDHYLLVDMNGFVNMVDALGGVSLTATSDVMSTGRLPGSSFQAGSFKKGQTLHLNGEQALAYSRSRTGSSDYARMRRQRCVVSALFHQADPVDLVSNLKDLQAIARDNVLTDVPLERVPSLLDAMDLLQGARASSLLLMPPTIQPSHWDLNEVRALVEQTWRTANGSPQQPALASTLTPPGGAAPATATPVENLSDACAE